jgi:hypothetical protein
MESNPLVLLALIVGGPTEYQRRNTRRSGRARWIADWGCEEKAPGIAGVRPDVCRVVLTASRHWYGESLNRTLS